ncbi:MAG: hypothetical protein WCG50_12580, partial [Rhodoferax sp.]|uniref:hypothetical protein n=1 Tax=Rhodoferax sp. TaxID=50421 RepID=UPI0030165C63
VIEGIDHRAVQIDDHGVYIFVIQMSRFLNNRHQAVSVGSLKLDDGHQESVRDISSKTGYLI